MRICTRYLIFFIVGFLALSSIGCQSSRGAYGNTKHHNGASHKKSSSKSSSSKKKKKSSSSKSSSKKSTTEKSTTEKSTTEKSSTEKSSSSSPAPEKEKQEEEKKWGYGFNLGALQFAGNTFQFGLAPNIVYKLEETWVVGFMLKVDYYYFKDSYYQAKYSSFGLGPTVFTRWKPLLNADKATPFMKGLFLQGEYEHASISQPYDEFGNINIVDDKIVGFRRWEDYVYVGIGTSTGYPFASFFSIHYNILDDINHTRVPFNWRLGFTWYY